MQIVACHEYSTEAHRDPANGASAVNDSATLEYMQSTFNDHYHGKRQPIGLYTHPIHVAVRTALPPTPVLPAG